MTPEQWRSVKDKIESLFGLEVSRRSAYLDEIAGSDHNLRRELESLLISHDSMAEDFLNVPLYPEPSVPISSAASLIGKRLGSYQIVSEIGKGGMGQVYRALRVDDQYQKEVAIKLISAERESAFVVARFKNERQILARLEHPNIARLLDGGATAEGVPYLVMELIEGESIIDYSNRRSLDITAQLKLFLQVCSAVQFAHQRLIIHRDIKPGNILVTRDGTPKLLDFGISKILGVENETGAADPTLTVFRMLTPAYASPEQVKGVPITTASDVYSLGVVLYELLTGRRPYCAEGSPEQIVRAICEQAPEKPSAAVRRSGGADATRPSSSSSTQRIGNQAVERLGKHLRGDLDNLVLMALRKEPERRYASVEQLAEDIRRYLGDLPIIARKDTTLYRASKFIMRHRAGLAGTAIVILTIITAFLITLREAQIARRRFNDVRQLANYLVFDVHDSIKELSGATSARQLLTQKASLYLDGLAKESGNDLALQRELASAYERLGMVQGEIGQGNEGNTAAALESYRKAQALEEKICKRGDTKDLLRYAGTYGDIARIQWNSGDAGNALRSGMKALDMLEALAQKEPDNADVLRVLGPNYTYVADLIPTTHERSILHGDADQTIERYYRRALEIDEKLASKSTDPKLRRTVAVDEFYFARYLRESGRWQEAVEMIDKAQSTTQSIIRSTGSTDKLRRDLATNDDAAGDAYLAGGRSIEALANYREANKILAARVEADPSDYDARLIFAENQLNIGNALRKMGRYSEALTYFQIGRKILAEAVVKDPGAQVVKQVLALAEMLTAKSLDGQRNLVAAAPYFNKAIARSKAATEADPSDLDGQITLTGLMEARADFLQSRSELSLAQDDYNQAIKICEPLLIKAPDSSELRSVLAKGYLGLAQVESARAEKSQAPGAQKILAWKQAKAYAQRSSDYFHQITHPILVTRNGLDSITATDIDRAISRCDTALAKLRSSAKTLKL